MQQTICPSLYFGHVKMKLVSMATLYAILKNGGCTNKINNMLAATQPKIQNLVPDYILDIYLLSYDQQCKLSNYANNLICIFMNINKKSCKCLESRKELPINLLILVIIYQCFMLL